MALKVAFYFKIPKDPFSFLLFSHSLIIQQPAPFEIFLTQVSNESIYNYLTLIYSIHSINSSKSTEACVLYQAAHEHTH